MSRKIDTVFVLALITLFAATSFVLVLIGAKQYRYVTNTMNENFEDRTVSSYLTEKIRQYDTEHAIFVTSLQEVPALAFLAYEEEVSYTTYIYYYEGALRELVLTENSVFSLSAGQEIIPMQGFTPTLVGDSLIRAKIIDTEGKEQTLYFTIHCGTGRRQR